MATTPVSVKNLQKGSFEATIVTAGPTTLFFPTDPRINTSIQVDKAGSTVTVEATTQTNVSAANDTVGIGIPLTDIEVAHYASLSTGTTDYLAGENKHITGVKVSVTTFVGNVLITISQVKD